MLGLTQCAFSEAHLFHKIILGIILGVKLVGQLIFEEEKFASIFIDIFFYKPQDGIVIPERIGESILVKLMRDVDLLPILNIACEKEFSQLGPFYQ